MPELPEVEVIRLFLDQHIVGKTITSLKIITQKPARRGGAFIGDPKKVINHKITSTSRVGKQLSIYLSSGDILLVHLKLTGQLIFNPPVKSIDTPKRVGGSRGVSVFGHPTNTINTKSARVIFTFSDKSLLYFNDQRKFGWIKLLSSLELAKSQENLGVDIFSPHFTSKYFFSQLSSTRRPIKTVLLDQSKFAGIGNIYANDTLFMAKIHPLTAANTIHNNLPAVAGLRKSLLKIMRQSVLSGGSTARDQTYIHPDGSKGNHQFHFLVYQQAGKPCPVCGTPIKRFTLGGRGTFFCPHCQPVFTKY